MAMKTSQKQRLLHANWIKYNKVVSGNLHNF